MSEFRLGDILILDPIELQISACNGTVNKEVINGLSLGLLYWHHTMGVLIRILIFN